MKNKFIYTLIIAVMASSLFTGCSKGEKPKEDVTIETTMAGETDNNESSDQPEQSVEADNTQNSEESNQNTSSDQPNETENATTSEKAETTTKNETTTQQNTSNMAGNETTKPTQTTKPTETTKPAETTTQKPSETPTTSAHTHTAGDWTVTKAATCSTDGTKVKKCTVCGVQTASETIIANGTHNYYWDGDNTMRTHRCSGCNYTGVTEYNINGAWGYFDDAKAAELWYWVNVQREATKTVIRDHKGNPIGDSTVPALNKNSELDAKAKNRAVAAALNFNHAGEQHECLAWGIGSGGEVMSSWFNSTSHRYAMLDIYYTQGGVAWFYYDSDNSGINLTPIAVLELAY